MQQSKPGHYELIPATEMPFEQYQELLNQVTFY
jgi:hypothetical protein